MLTWTSGERTAHGWLISPPGAESRVRYPLIIVGYRAKGAFDGGSNSEYPVQLWAQRGYRVLVYDYLDPVDADNRALSPAAWMAAAFGDDLKMARPSAEALGQIVNRLSTRGLIDPTRVGITGFSNGINAVNYSLINFPRRYAAAITSSSLASPITYYMSIGGPSEIMSAYSHSGFGRAGSGEDYNFDRLSLSRNIAKVRTPLLINGSDAEYLGSIEDVVTFREFGRPIDLYVYPDEDHVKWQPAHYASIWARNLDWMDFWLRNLEDPAPHKASQYAYWRTLRELGRK